MKLSIHFVHPEDSLSQSIMENVVSMSISTKAINLPTSVSPVASEVVTSPAEEVFSDAHPCLFIVPYQSTVDDPPSSPRFASPQSPSSPLISQKPRTFQGKAHPLSKKASTSSSLTEPFSKRGKPTCLSKSKLIGPTRPPSKTRLQNTPQKDQKKIPPKAPISNVDPLTIQCFVDAFKSFVYQRWFGSRELWFEQLVVLDDFLELHPFLKIRKWVHTVSKLSAAHPILIREFYANLDKIVIAKGHPSCFHRDSFGGSSYGSGSAAHAQGEPSISSLASNTVPRHPSTAIEPYPVSTAPHMVSLAALSQAESDKDEVPSAHVQ
uniref:Uncharacterized protein n=1 Tax=Cannabis sativa TaxID=3483 RepID=A0A803QJ43_CANSA